jgi:hypothetical protein
VSRDSPFSFFFFISLCVCVCGYNYKFSTELDGKNYLTFNTALFEAMQFITANWRCEVSSRALMVQISMSY